MDEWDAEDRELGFKPLVPLDLQIVGLPLLLFLKWRATSTDEYDVEADWERAEEGHEGESAMRASHS